MKKEKQVLLSGVQSSGKLHFGNYFGALRQNIELANSGEYDSYIFIADYHALSTLKNGEEMNENICDVVATYIALGLDINKCAFFKQSDNPYHFELFTILNNYVTVPYIMRAHAFKDHEAKSKEINVGLLTYPILMAADILLYQADIVPVGADQKQHIEFARDIAGFFNRAHKADFFSLPKDYIMPEVAIVPGIDGEKMSKSKNNHIPIFASDEEIEKRVKKIITDSNQPSTSDEWININNNIWNIHKHFLNGTQIQELHNKIINIYKDGNKYSYKESKDDLYQSIIDFRNQEVQVGDYKGQRRIDVYNQLIKDKNKISEILNTGKSKSINRSTDTMREIRKIIGVEI